jgi:hypothetical protein
VPAMLPHDYPHPPRTTRIVRKVHGGVAFEGGGSTNNPSGAFHSHTTKGFRHVRGKGPLGTLVPDEPPHALRHRTPVGGVVKQAHHVTWGGPSDHSAADYHATRMAAASSHRPQSKDGQWQHKTRKTASGVKATHASVDYDFLQPGEGYDDRSDSVRFAGSQTVATMAAKKLSKAYTSGAGDHDLITHKVDYRRGDGRDDPLAVAPPRPRRPKPPRTPNGSLRPGVLGAGKGRARHHGYDILTNTTYPECEPQERMQRNSMNTTRSMKNTLVPARRTSVAGPAVQDARGPEIYHGKTAKPQAIMNSEGYAYDILTHGSRCPDQLEKFDVKATRSFRRLANGQARKRRIRERGRVKAEARQQRRRNTIAKTRHIAEKSTGGRGFDIVSGARHRDLHVDDPRNNPKIVGVKPRSWWSKCSGSSHDTTRLRDNPHIGLKNTAGRAAHTVLPKPEPGYIQRAGQLGKLPSRVTRAQDIVHNDLLGFHFHDSTF